MEKKREKDNNIFAGRVKKITWWKIKENNNLFYISIIHFIIYIYIFII